MKQIILGAVIFCCLIGSLHGQSDDFVRCSREMFSEISKGNLATVKKLFAHYVIDPNEDRSSVRRGTKGPSAKDFVDHINLAGASGGACTGGNSRCFLKAGADINQPIGEPSQFYRYPIDLAVATHSGDAFANLLSYLLKHGANPNLGSATWPPIVVVLTNSAQSGQIDYAVSLCKKVVVAGGDPNPKGELKARFAISLKGTCLGVP